MNFRIGSISPRTLIFLVSVVLTAGYLLYQGRGVIFSPSLKVFTPENGSVFENSSVLVAGKSLPGIIVWVAGKEIRTDENGFFKETLILQPGYHSLGVYVIDDFGSRTKEVLQIVVK
jgi:hypothetical protein